MPIRPTSIRRNSAQAAAERGLRCTTHAFGTFINVAACAHLLSVIPNADLLEFPMELSPIRDAGTEPAMLVDGHLRVPTAPGLGWMVDESSLGRLRVA